MKLGVNVDHIATLRQARRGIYPDPVVAALLAQRAGCDSIVAHLREDRRHIQDRDIILLKQVLRAPLNLEMSINPAIVALACRIKPSQATLVPERRQELTTEGGIDLVRQAQQVKEVIKQLKAAKIKVSVFIDPMRKQVEQAKKVDADIVELNSGKYSQAKTKLAIKQQLDKIKQASGYAKQIGFFVACGHGLNAENVKPIAQIKAIEEFNIGHSIISKSVFIGLVAAVEEMISLINTKSETEKI